MARWIKHIASRPIPVEVGAEKKWICMCGLTKNPPFCDGRHKHTVGEEEGKFYRYDENGVRTETSE